MKPILALLLVFYAESISVRDDFYARITPTRELKAGPVAILPAVSHPVLGGADQIKQTQDVPVDFDQLVSLPSSLEDNSFRFLFRGDYWLRIDLWNSAATSEEVVLANDHVMEKVLLVTENQSSRHFGIYEYRDTKSARPYFNLILPPGVSTYFLRVSSYTHPSLLKLRLWSQDTFYIDLKSRQRGDKEIYLALFLWLYHVVFFLIVRRPAYLYLAFAMGGFLLFFAAIKGFQPVVQWEFFYKLGPLLPLLMVMGIVGSQKFYYYIHTVDPVKERVLYNSYRLLSLVNLGLCVYLAFYPSNIQAWMFSPCALIVILTYWGSYKYRHLERYKSGRVYMFVAIPFAMSGVGMIFQVAGFYPHAAFSIDIQFLTISIFLTGISLILGITAQKQASKTQQIRHSILLGNAVQELITPPRIDENFNGIDFYARYIPYENQMSGDWIQRWRTRDGSQHFLIGDVAGKGPQAALAVGVISMAVYQCMRMDKDVKQAICEINTALHEVFNGAITTTALGVCVTKDHKVSVFQAACPPWEWIRDGKVKTMSQAGPILGIQNEIELTPTTFELKKGDVLLGFTDGFQLKNGTNRHLVKFIENLLKEKSFGDQLASPQSHIHTRHAVSIDEVCNWALDFETPDDRAIFIIEASGEHKNFELLALASNSQEHAGRFAAG